MNGAAAQLARPAASERDARYSVRLTGELAKLLGVSLRTLQRWAAKQEGEGATQLSGEYSVDPLRFMVSGVPLDSRLRGLRVGRADVNGVKVSDECERASLPAQRKMLNILADTRQWDGFAEMNGMTPRSVRSFRAYVAFVGKAALKARRVPSDYGCFMDWIKRRIPEGDIEESRGRAPKPQADVHPDDIAFYAGLQLNPNRVKAAPAMLVAEQKAENEGRKLPSEQTMRRRMKAIPDIDAIKQFAQGGPQAFKIHAEPKFDNPLRPVREVMDQVSLDATRDDHYVWVPCRGSGYRYIRAMVTALVEDSTGFPLDAEPATSENSDVTARVLTRAAINYGLWRKLNTDNGPGFKSRLGKTDERIAEMLGVAKDRLGFEVEFCPVREPWTKYIECAFRGFKEWDRLDPVWAGNFVDMKPHDIQVKLAALGPDPQFSLQHYREVDFPKKLEMWRNLPSAACGGLSRAVYFEQRRQNVRTAPEAMIRLAFSVRRGDIETGVMTNRGIRYAGGCYDARELWPHIARRTKFGILPDPTNAGIITVIDLDNGRVVCRAEDRRLRGTTPEEVREVLSERRRFRRQCKQRADALRIEMTPTMAGKVRELRAQKLDALAAAQRAALPPPPELSISIVASPAAADAIAAEKPRTGPAPREPGQASGFARLAQKFRDEEALAEEPTEAVNRWARHNVESDELRELDIEDLPLEFESPFIDRHGNSRFDFSNSGRDAIDDWVDTQDWNAGLPNREEADAARDAGEAQTDESTGAEDAA